MRPWFRLTCCFLSAGHYLKFRTRNLLIRLNHISTDVKWSRSSDGWLKCNVDAGVFHACGMIGSGAMFHDCHGYFVVAQFDA